MTQHHEPATGAPVHTVARVHAGGAPVDVHALTRPDLQGRRAGIVSRGIANVLDAAVVFGVLVAGYAGVTAVKFLWSPRTFRFPQPTLPLAVIVGAAVTFAYFTLAWRLLGRTWGDEVLGLRVVNARGTRMAWLLSALRAALCVAFPIALVWVVVSSQNRSVQDVLLGTSVIYDWPARA